MEFISTKDMDLTQAPEGTVLVKYLEPSWGGWYLQYALGYFDNPLDYEDPRDGEGWKHEITGNKINVVAYCKLPVHNQEIENPWVNHTQKETLEKYGSHPNLGNVGIL